MPIRCAEEQEGRSGAALGITMQDLTVSAGSLW